MLTLDQPTGHWKINNREQKQIQYRGAVNVQSSWVCLSQTPKTGPVIPPAFILHTAYSWPTPCPTTVHTVLSKAWQQCKLKTVEWLWSSTEPYTLRISLRWNMTAGLSQSTNQSLQYNSVKGPVVWGFGGLVVGTTLSLGSFRRCVCLCGLAAIVPGLPGALEGLRPLLVHNHVVNTLIWCCHASSITFHLERESTHRLILIFFIIGFPWWLHVSFQVWE